MKKILVIIMAIFPILLLTECSTGDKELSSEEMAMQAQTKMYNLVLSNIVGHWKGYQHYNTSSGGWEDISYISWTQEYVFNSNGTCKDIRSSKTIYESTYSIVKNEGYIKYPSTDCELFIIITNNNGLVHKYAIWMEEGCLRLGYSSLGARPSASSGGEASIRYRKV